MSSVNSEPGLYLSLDTGLYSQVWFGRESSVSEEFALHADTCNLFSGFLATDYMSFLQSPGTEGQNMRQIKTVFLKIKNMKLVGFWNSSPHFVLYYLLDSKTHYCV